ncbi:MAG: hypothetical protein COA78_14175 [Blastopirellula sp.]|nr:MAG: hypothetical protein COA78_14175 [Blastopirellula sp.]
MINSIKFKSAITALYILGLIGVANADGRSNANDSFVTDPNGSGEIDLGETIHLDSKGYPKLESFQTIYDEMDYQGAVSAYLQAIPQMALFGSLKTNHFYGATGNTDTLVMHKDPAVNGMLTPNKVVFYGVNIANLAESGPMVYEYPAGATAGLIMDMQMRFRADLGLTSLYTGRQVVKYLVLTEDQDLPDESINQEKHEYVVVRVKTNQVFFGYRVLDPVNSPGLERELKIYPYSERDEPKPNKFFQAKKSDDTYFMTQPIGMAYWERLHEYIQIERVNEADRFMMARLKAVGIEIGKDFNPTPRQIKILKKAAMVGEKMAMISSFAARSQAAKYRDDSKWVHPLTLNPSHRDGPIYQLEQRVDWAFEAYGVSTAMQAGIPGKGSTYLAAYRDKEGQWLDGEKEYVFHIAPDAPAARFWDLSVYRMETRGLLPFKEGSINAINTFTENLKKNADGSIDIYFGPGKAQEGYENNFINTIEGMRWFCYFRLYGPTTTYFDRSWKMYDIQKINHNQKGKH